MCLHRLQSPDQTLSDPKASVIIPTYNRGEVIERSVRSALNQSVSDIEVIVIDDGSTDNTEKTITSINDDRLKYIYQKNSGANAARNTGLRESCGEYVSFLDSDDVLHKEHLLYTINRIEQASESCLGAATAYISVSDKNRVRSSIPNQELGLEYVSNTNPVGGFSTLTFKSKVTENIGLLDEGLPSLQDYDYIIRVCEHNTIVGVNKILLTKYTNTVNRISDDVNKKKQGNKKILEKHGGKLGKRRKSTQAISIGKIHMSNDNFRSAKKYFVFSIKIDPTNMSAIFYLLASLNNQPSFNKIVNLKNNLLTKFRHIKNVLQ